MSGIKESYVTMTTSQRDSMLRQCRESQNEAARQSERAAQMERANRDAQSRITALDNKVNAEISGLSNEMREIERKQNEAFRSALEKQGADIRREMQEQRQELTQMIGDIDRQINAKEQSHKQIAEFWMSQAEAYLKEIESYRHEMFTPNRLQILRTKLGQIHGDISAQAYQSAISTARDIFNDAVVLRSDVVVAELEWVRYFERLSNDVAALSSTINETKLLELQVGDERIQARVDYWTNGALTELERRVLEIQDVLHKPEGVTADRLVALISEVDDLKQRLLSEKTGLIDSAKEALMLSAYRADMVDDISRVLSESGWRLEDYTYRNCEQREAIHAKIVDGMGNELVVIVEPQVNQGKLENKLMLNFFNDQELDSSNTELRVSSIRDTLRQNGLKIDLRCVDGYESMPSDRNELRNIERVRTQKTE